MIRFAPVAALLLLAGPACAQTDAPRAEARELQDERPELWSPGVPTELYDVVRVVDGDTIHVLRDGETVKLRLLSVDTEEKLSGRAFDPAKPETVFGQETMIWAQELFAALATDDAPARVGLSFPGGVEEFDVYGRLLCHVVLPDGEDFNLKLVREGWSPYFNKYGNSRICHEAFRAAQVHARANQLGIWNPATNRPDDPNEPAAKRDYDAMLPWWECRAVAIDLFRAERAADPASICGADDPESMAAAAARCAADEDATVRLFGLVDRTFDERDGSLTVLFRTPHRERALRVRVPGPLRSSLAELDVQNRNEVGRQNHLVATGRLVDTGRGFEIRFGDPGTTLEVYGPEPDPLEVGVSEAGASLPR